MQSKPSRSAEDKFRDILRTAGYRATTQRLLLLRLLQDNKGHTSADDLYARAHARDPRLSLSTVYRTLNSLKEAGMVRELHLDQDHHHYELADKEDHYHLVCQGCGRVLEVECFVIDEMLSRIQDRYQFQVTGTQMEFVGYCAGCQARQRSAEE
jgi:Fur family ferric uptake transcriptional regulator